MKTHEKILEEFGKILAKESFDSSLLKIENLRSIKNPLLDYDPHIKYLQSLSKEDYEKLLVFVP